MKMFKIIINVILLTFFVTSCADTFNSVKKGLTGAKSDSADEFLVKKKAPLILPPDFENLPSPEETITVTEDLSEFEKNMKSATEEEVSSSSSAEDSILKQIQSK